jgi:thiol-disulfide isomerase/thioredoxin
MNRKHFFAAFIFFLFVLPFHAQDVANPERVIQKVADKFNSVEHLGYKYRFRLTSPSQGRDIHMEADAFIDLKPEPESSRFRFQFTSADMFTAYNGTEQFTARKTDKKLYVESDPVFNSFGSMLLMHSPIALKYALPKILADKTVSKKVSEVRTGDRQAVLIEFSLKKRIITSEGGIVEIRPDNANLYRITIDEKTLLPIEVVQSNDKNDEVIRTTYSDITEKPAIPQAGSWYFSTFLKEYTLQRNDKLSLIEAGRQAPNFKLAKFNSNESISFNGNAGKVLLIEFWIAHCGFCIAAVPRLNSLAKKFPGMEVISINMYDSATTIDAFKKRNGVEYTILTGGDLIAADYGVDAFPALVLIDAKGKVVYSSSGLFEDELTLAIEAALNR